MSMRAVGVQHKGIPRDTGSPRGGNTEQHCQALTGRLAEILYFMFFPISLDLLSRSVELTGNFHCAETKFNYFAIFFSG